MINQKYKESPDITTNTDKIRLALKEYRNKREYGKELFSSILTLASLIFVVISSDFHDKWGITALQIELISLILILILSTYILYLVIIGIATRIKKNDTLEWFKNELLGIEQKNNFNIRSLISSIFEGIWESVAFLWRIIGYLVLIIVYTLPLIIMAFIANSIGWKELLIIHDAGEVPYIVPFLFFGVMGIGLYYYLVFATLEGIVIEKIRDFFEKIFDIDAPYF